VAQSIPHLAGKQELVAFIIADDQRIERVVRRVATDDECLRFVDLVLEPRAASLADVGQN
jgi:hypothetical protein